MQEPHEERLAPGLTIEDHGDAFYLILEGEGCDITISIENDQARKLAAFIQRRQGNGRN